jgi:hypothetical protein
MNFLGQRIASADKTESRIREVRAKQEDLKGLRSTGAKVLGAIGLATAVSLNKSESRFEKLLKPEGWSRLGEQMSKYPEHDLPDSSRPGRITKRVKLPELGSELAELFISRGRQREERAEDYLKHPISKVQANEGFVALHEVGLTSFELGNEFSLIELNLFWPGDELPSYTVPILPEDFANLEPINVALLLILPDAIAEAYSMQVQSEYSSPDIDGMSSGLF